MLNVKCSSPVMFVIHAKNIISAMSMTKSTSPACALCPKHRSVKRHHSSKKNAKWFRDTLPWEEVFSKPLLTLLWEDYHFNLLSNNIHEPFSQKMVLLGKRAELYPILEFYLIYRNTDSLSTDYLIKIGCVWALFLIKLKEFKKK